MHAQESRRMAETEPHPTPTHRPHLSSQDNKEATASSTPSSPRRPTICNPSGHPSAPTPAGTLTAGCPLRLKAQVRAVEYRSPGPSCP